MRKPLLFLTVSQPLIEANSYPRFGIIVGTAG